MNLEYDTVIRRGTVVDGTAGDVFKADVGISNGVIAAIGRNLSRGKSEIDAHGLLVTPGFVDIHTHYDGQVTWDDTLMPSTDHGVTTVVMGNCGVGFAPCRPADREALVVLMEGVEDLPEIVLSAGLPWEWEDFGSYLDFLDGRSFNIDIAAQVAHAPIRVWAMGERAFTHEPATAADAAKMAQLVAQAIKAGALGFSTSRSLNHKGSDGRVTPSWRAAENELSTIARALSECGAGVLQVISDFDDAEAEMAMLERVCRAGGRPMSISLLQKHRAPSLWREILNWIGRMNADGMQVKAQVSDRIVGGLRGLELSNNPLAGAPSYQAIAHIPLSERARLLAAPELRNRIISELGSVATKFDFDAMYPLGDPPNYEPAPDRFIGRMALRFGTDPLGLLYDLMLEDEGRAIIAQPSSNYAEGSLDVCGQMMRHPDTIFGLSDGGAHVGILCDSSQPTHLLTHWVRDRSHDRLPLASAIAGLSRDTARALGLLDRGVIAEGMRADINVIDHDRLSLSAPIVTYDLPAGGRRLRQPAQGYVATLVAGEVIARDGVDTGVRPGRLIRGAQAAPAGRR
jgi:N-acyl-D-aspartate/D-glutamate deacylase